jgi:hypothetical protein
MFLDAGPSPGSASIQYSEHHFQSASPNPIVPFRRLISNLFQLLKVLSHTRIQLNDSGTLSVTHGNSQVRMRQDGNIDLIGSRNILMLTPRGLIHLNPVSVSDDRFTEYELLHASQSR